MNELKECKECHECIKGDDEIVELDNGNLYHQDCCDVFPVQFGVMIGGDYKGNSDDGVQTAYTVLHFGEYIDEEDAE